jgi:hypothetical protein
MQSTITLTTDVEGTVFTLDRDTEDLCETPGRVSLYINTGYSSQKIYFDELDSLGLIANLLLTMENMVLAAGEKVPA